jgi:hypothetical protein
VAWVGAFRRWCGPGRGSHSYRRLAGQDQRGGSDPECADFCAPTFAALLTAKECDREDLVATADNEQASAEAAAAADEEAAEAEGSERSKELAEAAREAEPAAADDATEIAEEGDNSISQWLSPGAVAAGGQVAEPEPEPELEATQAKGQQTNRTQEQQPEPERAQEQEQHRAKLAALLKAPVRLGATTKAPPQLGSSSAGAGAGPGPTNSFNKHTLAILLGVCAGCVLVALAVFHPTAGVLARRAQASHREGAGLAGNGSNGSHDGGAGAGSGGSYGDSLKTPAAPPSGLGGNLEEGQWGVGLNTPAPETSI